MDTYVVLGKYTQQGLADIGESPARLEEARKAIAAAGGKLVAWYLLLGRFDFLVITEAPDAKAAASVILAIGAQGNISTETLHALTEEEFQGVVTSLP